MKELRARNESVMASQITADECIDTEEYLCTYGTLAMSDQRILSGVGNPDEEAAEDKVEWKIVEYVIQPPTRSEVVQALEMLQTRTYYYAENGDEVRGMVNTFFKA